jgi:transposase, IS5 family
MKLFNTLFLKFERSDWAKNPEMGLIDTLLETHPALYASMSADITRGCKSSEFGRQDTPSVEQVVRAAVLKEFKAWSYRDLEYAQTDSRICAAFIKLDERRPYSFQTWHKYISKVRAESLQEFLLALNKIAISQGLEDLESLRTDSTVVETNIHFPTNNSLVWDCIREAHRLLGKLAEQEGIAVRDYTAGAKSTYFKINNTKADKRAALFKKQLACLTKSIKQVGRFAKKKDYSSIASPALALALGKLLPLMEQVHSMAERREVQGQKVANQDKLFSIYELHTDIIVKGGRQAQFGHKVNLSQGRSLLILGCQIERGNPADSKLFQPCLEEMIDKYGRAPKSVATDGGYASKANQEHATERGVVNVVFNKIVGSLKNLASSKSMETRLKKWRSGMEATISNLKRRFNLFRCNWKGWEHYQAKVLWGVIAYNIRVMTGLVVGALQTK